MPDFDLPDWVSTPADGVDRRPMEKAQVATGTHSVPTPEVAGPQRISGVPRGTQPPPRAPQRVLGAPTRRARRATKRRRTWAAALLVSALGLALAWWRPWSPATPTSSPAAGVDAAASVADHGSTSAAPTPIPTPTPDLIDGPGTFTRVSLASPPSSAPNGSRVITVGLQIENGLGIDPGQTATKLVATLSDARSWQAMAKVDFRFVGPDVADPAVLVTLASPTTTDELCRPLDTMGDRSCFNLHKVVVNSQRWIHGTSLYDDLESYRTYVLNHEVGHALGRSHVPCPGHGKPAPVMLQQTLRLDGCSANPWPSVA